MIITNIIIIVNHGKDVMSDDHHRDNVHEPDNHDWGALRSIFQIYACLI